ncbi:hypothetical protein HID58_010677 [Brassica napus]|uniref:Secreted protein n=3 Tax=Brassica TaxID=3705 RepID=A0ABQ8BTU9_BRANA|nr:hypothetical protein HID58_031524 [Brassica napus]KAH0933560.1 hypothetical protein HID58_010677 [Brassica napus]VDC89380.1 unnamed protein product [Brassica rapa]
MAVLLVALLSGVVSSLQRNDEGGSARISQTCVTMAIRTISKRLGFGVGSSDPGWRPTGMPTAGVQFGVGTQFLELSFAHTIILSAIRLFVCD